LTEFDSAIDLVIGSKTSAEVKKNAATASPFGVEKQETRNKSDVIPRGYTKE
jgi:hypothetical protein